MDPVTIRMYEERDLPFMLAIYQPFALSSHITPEYGPIEESRFRERIDRFRVQYPVLVAEGAEGSLLGYAYAHEYRGAQGHQWSAESTIYLAEGGKARGLAAALYERLFALLQRQGYINVFAGIVLPNPPSEAFHRKMGFTEVGTFRRGMHKNGSWHDIRWYQLGLQPHRPDPPLPRPITTILP